MEYEQNPNCNPTEHKTNPQKLVTTQEFTKSAYGLLNLNHQKNLVSAQVNYFNFQVKFESN